MLGPCDELPEGGRAGNRVVFGVKGRELGVRGASTLVEGGDQRRLDRWSFLASY